jgi:putative oxidoreductase
MNDFFAQLKPYAHNLWRIMIGFAFFTHGGQKLMGWFGRDAADLVSAQGAAGLLEFVGGLAIILGLFTRPVAFVLAGEMAVAYWWRHVARNDGALFHWQNGGELAMVFCFTFLFMAAVGGGSFSLDGKLFKKN